MNDKLGEQIRVSQYVTLLPVGPSNGNQSVSPLMRTELYFAIFPRANRIPSIRDFQINHYASNKMKNEMYLVLLEIS